MRFPSVPLMLITSTLTTLPALANSVAIGTIQVSPDLRSALLSLPNPAANPHALQSVSDLAELENRLEILPVPTRPEPKVYRQFEEPRNHRGLGFKVGI